MKRLLILGAPIFQIEVVSKAKELNLYVGIIDTDVNSPAMKYADEYFVCSILDKTRTLEIAQKFKPDGIMAGACDTSVNTVAYLCGKLGLPGNSEETALLATDKYKMIKAFSEHNVSHPEFIYVGKDKIGMVKNTIPFPVIVKPVDSAGGRGVNLVKNESDILDAEIDSSRYGKSGDIIIEEYMEGPEVSVEMLIINKVPYVLQITDKANSGPPFFYEVGHTQPSSLDTKIQNNIKKLVEKAVMALGINNGPAHCEVKITSNGVKMIELGARLGGDCITSYLIDNSIKGIDMKEAAIKIALGEDIQPINYVNSGKYVSVRFIAAKRGILKKLDQTADLNMSRNLIKCRLFGVVGKNYVGARDNSARLGYVVCSGDTKEESINNCLKTIDSLVIEYED